MMKALKTIIIFLFVSVFGYSQTYPWAEFNATEDSYINLGDAAHLNGYDQICDNNHFSITMWIRWGDKSNPGVGNWANFFTLSDSTSGDNGIFWMQHDYGNTKFEFAIQTTSGRSYIQSTTNPVESTWYHLAATYDATLSSKNMKLYINGNVEATKNKTGAIRSMFDKAKLTIGRWPAPANNFRMLHGDIDEVSVWAKTLSQSEIQAIMTTLEDISGTNYDTSNIVSYYNFSGGSMVDLVVGGNNGIGGASVLPVELKEFRIEKEEQHVNLIWVTLSEINNDFFSVEKSKELDEFELIEKVTGAGNSNNPIEFTATDFNPFPGISYYRLSQTDFDGKESILDIGKLNFNDIEEFDVMLYPNPIIKGSSFYLKIPFAVESEFNLLVNDFLGKECITDMSLINRDDHTLLILQTEEDITPGIYFVTFQLGDKVITKKIMIK